MLVKNLGGITNIIIGAFKLNTFSECLIKVSLYYIHRYVILVVLLWQYIFVALIDQQTVENKIFFIKHNMIFGLVCASFSFAFFNYLSFQL